jgi:Pyruvate/2-oxoacid:ferredoxin oxidoreductase gamma subunit
MLEGRDVQLFGSYGGMMRGGNTDAELVIADGSIEAPPTVGTAWTAVLMHPDYASTALARVRPGGVVVREAGLWNGPLPRADVQVVDVPAVERAVEAGNVMAASMVMLGALSTLTGLVMLDSLFVGVDLCVPPYRRQHLELNQRALRSGASSVTPAPTFQAWPMAATAIPAS